MPDLMTSRVWDKEQSAVDMNLVHCHPYNPGNFWNLCRTSGGDQNSDNVFRPVMITKRAQVQFMQFNEMQGTPLKSLTVQS